ncbi:uncharacterized protein LOC133818772 isoform X3 [Humulus lupulus]|uniref:uncharacterized protein LOC133818772 isoform X3 n=1 Tax=Humulus lupulus TaxID=3486 RepID=UPI002B409636|nr:uncharacterized protein LOC133818772 isoform X3 [Humulus lupulus]
MTEVCPTEDAVLALLEYLVDPMLPARSAMHNPSASQQQALAKQVHAVVLLYNYYHRKQYPKLEFLGFDSFCKLAVVLKPALLAHLKLTQMPNYTKLDDPENQLSPTEKSIMQACDISTTLDALREDPIVKGWPITKVAVFLVNSKKENCLLVFSSVTEGVWSVIEKDVEVSNQSLGTTMETNQTYKRNRLLQKIPRAESRINLTDFQQLAYLAVKEATGITQTDLMILEDHLVYSTTKEKTVAQFYIMQTKLFKEDAVPVSIKDVIDSLQGPLVKKNSGNWTVTPVVEYLHVLPYGGILSNWMNRQGPSPERTKIPRELAENKIQVNFHAGGMGEVNSHKITATDLKLPKEKDVIGFSNASNGPQVLPSEEKCNNLASGVDIKSLQLRSIEDEIAECDKKIQTILNGGEDDLKLKIESLIEGCNEESLQSVAHERTNQPLENTLSPQYNKRKRLTEAIFSTQNALRELDAICNANNWILPTYHINPAEGGYRANVSIQGAGFDCSSVGEVHSSPGEARESAAARILVKLRIKATQSR